MRRHLTRFLAASLSVALLVLPTAGPAAAQGLPSPPVLKVTPYCVPPPLPAEVIPPIDFAVSGRNFTPSSTVRIDIGPFIDGRPQDPFMTVAVSEYGAFDTTLKLTPNALEVVASQLDNGDITVTRPVITPCPADIAVEPRCGPVVETASPDGPFYDIPVQGTGWDPRFGVGVQFLAEGFPVAPLVELQPDESGGFTTTIRQPQLPAGRYAIEAYQPRTETRVVVEFRTPCPEPTLVLQPICGPRGVATDRYQVAVSGTGFIPNRGIEFEFEPGPRSHFFYYDRDTPETGILDPQSIEPFGRPDGTYEVVARQFDAARVALEARATFTVPCADPTIAIEPADCGPPQLLGDEPRRYELTVRGRDFAPNAGLVVTFDADSADPAFPPEAFQTATDPGGAFQLAITPLRRPAGAVRVSAAQALRAPVEVSATFRIPCAPPRPRIAITPVCGPEAAGVAGAYGISVRLAGFIPGYVEIIFDAAGTPEVDTVGENGRLSHMLVPTGRSPGKYLITARQQDARAVLAERSATFTVPCPVRTTPTPAPTAATLTIVPASGPGGSVAFAMGGGFPAGATITLRWDRGIGAARGIVAVADETGAFRKPVLIFHRDFAGGRMMLAGTPEDPAAFPDAKAAFVVVPGSGSPPAFAIIDPFTGQPTEGGPIVFRR